MVKLAVDCNREVNICHQNSWGRFIDFKLSVCPRFLIRFVGFVMQKWLQWVSKCHKSAIFSDRIAIPKTLMVQGMENLLPLKFWWKSTYPSVRCFLGMVVKTVKNGLSFAAKRGSKHNDGTWLVNFRRKCDLIRAWLKTPRELWTKEKICPLCWLKSLPPGVNNLFRGIPFSQGDEKHEHTQESLLLGRKTKGNLAWCFHSFLQVFARGVLQKISYFDGKEWPIKARWITERYY